MTPQMLHATLSTGQITIWEDRLDVAPKTQQQVLDWLRREEGLRPCGLRRAGPGNAVPAAQPSGSLPGDGLSRSRTTALTASLCCRGGQGRSSSMKNMSGTPIIGRSPCMFGSWRTAGWTATPPFCGYGSNCWRVSAGRGWPSAGRRRCL